MLTISLYTTHTFIKECIISFPFFRRVDMFHPRPILKVEVERFSESHYKPSTSRGQLEHAEVFQVSEYRDDRTEALREFVDNSHPLSAAALEHDGIAFERRPSAREQLRCLAFVRHQKRANAGFRA